MNIKQKCPSNKHALRQVFLFNATVLCFSSLRQFLCVLYLLLLQYMPLVFSFLLSFLHHLERSSACVFDTKCCTRRSPVSRTCWKFQSHGLHICCHIPR